MPDINDIENHHLGEHRIRIGKYEGAISSIYRKYTNLFTNLGLSIADYDPEKLFSFYSYPTTNKMAKKLLAQMKAEIFKTISDGITYEWSAANKKNDSIVKRIYQTRRPPKRYNNHNLDALNAFKKRKTNGLNLSDRVWNYTNQFKREIELSLDVGLKEGKSAAEMSRDVRQYLNKPDMLFRRIRNKKGKLVPSKAMKAYHPGRGVYRSSAQNALRTTATETNMAYRQSDVERYRQLDFIVGYEVHTSNNHPVPDMCDDLKGKYPKHFTFTGWHPRCRCYITSILKTDAELDEDSRRRLNDLPVLQGSVNEVTDVPKGFKKWIRDNESRIKNAKSKPYFIRDNFKYGNIEKGLKFNTVDSKVSASAKSIKTKLNKYNSSTTTQKTFASFEPFSPIIIKRLDKLRTAKEKQTLLKSIVSDEAFVLLDLKSTGEGITKVHPLHKKGKGWIHEKQMARDLNNAGIDVFFLPEYTNKTSADAITTINERLRIADFKFSASTNYNTISEEIIKGFLQGGNVVLKLTKADMGTFNKIIEQIRRNYGKWADMTIINRYGQKIDLSWKQLRSGRYKKIMKGFL